MVRTGEAKTLHISTKIDLSVFPAESEKLSPSKLPPVNPVKVHPWRTPTTSASFLKVMFRIEVWMSSTVDIQTSSKTPERPIAGKVAETSLFAHSHVQLPTSGAAIAENSYKQPWN